MAQVHPSTSQLMDLFQQSRMKGEEANLSMDTRDSKVYITFSIGTSSSAGNPAVLSRSRPVRKRKSPSQIRRDQKRKEIFNAKKSSTSVENDVATGATVTAEKDIEVEKDDAYYCKICDFKSNWTNGLSIHMTRKHPNIEQLDGNSTIEDLEKDEQYENTKHYWKEGYLGTVFQVFIDANKIIEESHLGSECKNAEKDKVLDARKRAFGDNYKYFPPWM